MCGTSNLKSFNATNTNKDTLPPPWLLSTMSSFFFSLESGSMPGRLKLEPKTLEPSFTNEGVYNIMQLGDVRVCQRQTKPYQARQTKVYSMPHWPKARQEGVLLSGTVVVDMGWGRRLVVNVTGFVVCLWLLVMDFGTCDNRNAPDHVLVKPSRQAEIHSQRTHNETFTENCERWQAKNMMNGREKGSTEQTCLVPF